MLCLIVSFDLIQMKWYVTYVYIFNYFFLTLHQDTLKDFLEKREHGQLMYQKRTKLEQTIFKKVS